VCPASVCLSAPFCESQNWAVAVLLKAKANAEEAYEYKRWIINVAHKVASAAKEGGVFGFGGTQISGNEIEIINEIGAALEL
jgi:hypothetical protein